MTMYEHYESKVIDAIEMALGASWWDNLSEEAQDRIHDNLFSALNDDVAQPQQEEGVNCSAQSGPTNIDYTAACMAYDEYICDLDPVAPKNFRTWCEQRLHSPKAANDA